MFIKISEIIDTLRETSAIYVESQVEGKVEMLKSIARCVIYHEECAVVK